MENKLFSHEKENFFLIFFLIDLEIFSCKIFLKPQNDCFFAVESVKFFKFFCSILNFLEGGR